MTYLPVLSVSRVLAHGAMAELTDLKWSGVLLSGGQRVPVTGTGVPPAAGRPVAVRLELAAGTPDEDGALGVRVLEWE